METIKDDAAAGTGIRACCGADKVLAVNYSMPLTK